MFWSQWHFKVEHCNDTLISCLFFHVEVVVNEEEQCDTDLERQNVEELYDYVRHLHQGESQEVTCDIQHKALIPVLRPYQSQAVNWMLKREKYRNTSQKGRVSYHCPDFSTAQIIHNLMGLFFIYFLQFCCRTIATLPLAGVCNFVWKEVVLQPFYWLVRT